MSFKQVVVVISFYANGLVKFKSELFYRKNIIQNKQILEGDSDIMTAFSYHSEKLSDITVFSCLCLSLTVKVLSFFGYMIYLSPSKILYSTFMLIVLGGPLIYLEKKSKIVNRKIFELKNSLNQHYSDYLNQKSTNENVEKESDSYATKRIHFEILMGLKKAYPELLVVIFICVLLFLYNSGFVDGEKGELVTFLYMLLKLAYSLAEFNFFFSLIKLNLESYKHTSIYWPQEMLKNNES